MIYNYWTWMNNKRQTTSNVEILAEKTWGMGKNCLCHPWSCLRGMCVQHWFSCGHVVLGGWLHLTILKVFSHLNDSMFLWFRCFYATGFKQFFHVFTIISWNFKNFNKKEYKHLKANNGLDSKVTVPWRRIFMTVDSLFQRD